MAGVLVPRSRVPLRHGVATTALTLVALVGCTPQPAHPDHPTSPAAPAAQPTPKPAEPAPQPVSLPGDVHVGFGEAVDLGWITLRLREIKPCGRENAAVVDIAIRTPVTFSQGQW